MRPSIADTYMHLIMTVEHTYANPISISQDAAQSIFQAIRERVAAETILTDAKTAHRNVMLRYLRSVKDETINITPLPDGQQNRIFIFSREDECLKVSLLVADNDGATGPAPITIPLYQDFGSLLKVNNPGASDAAANLMLLHAAIVGFYQSGEHDRYKCVARNNPMVVKINRKRKAYGNEPVPDLVEVVSLSKRGSK